MGIFRKKINLSEQTLELAQRACEISGASSLDEFLDEVVTRESEKIINAAGKADVSQAEIDDISNKLKGLGYLE